MNNILGFPLKRLSHYVSGDTVSFLMSDGTWEKGIVVNPGVRTVIVKSLQTKPRFYKAIEKATSIQPRLPDPIVVPVDYTESTEWVKNRLA